MNGSSESEGGNIIISLSRKEAREAKLACMKEKSGDEKYEHIREAEDEFSRAYEDDSDSYYENTRFLMSPRAASAASRALEIHSTRSMSTKVRQQVAMQGVVID